MLKIEEHEKVGRTSVRVKKWHVGIKEGNAA